MYTRTLDVVQQGSEAEHVWREAAGVLLLAGRSHGRQSYLLWVFSMLDLMETSLAPVLSIQVLCLLGSGQTHGRHFLQAHQHAAVPVSCSTSCMT
jgi:hypothetical protein